MSSGTIDRGTVLADDAPQKEALFLRYTLSSVKGRVKLVELGSLSCLLLAVACAGFLAIILCDHFRGGLSEGWRLLGRIILLVVLIGGFVWLAAVWLMRKISDLYAARLVEKSNPQLRENLTAWVEFSQTGQIPPDMVGSIERRAAATMDQEQAQSAVAARRLRQCAIILGAVVGLFFAYSIFSPKSVWSSALRTFGAGVGAPTRVQILSYSPADGTETMARQAVTFSAQIRNPSGDATVMISRDGGATFLPEDRLRMKSGDKDRDGSELFSADLPEGFGQDLAYRIVCGDAATALTRLTVIHAPAIARIEITIHWPDYAARPASVIHGGRIAAFAHSRIELLAQSTLPVEKAEIFFEEDGGRKWSSPAIVDGMKISTTFGVVKCGRYKIVMTAIDSRAVGESIWYPVEIGTDIAPTINMIDPQSGLVELGVDEKLKLTAEVADDTGLSSCRLSCASQLQGAAGSDGKRVYIPLGQFAPAGAKMFAIDAQAPVSSIGTIGQSLLCRIEAFDFSPNPVSPSPIAGEKGNFAKGREFLLIIKPPVGAAKESPDGSARQESQKSFGGDSAQSSQSEGSSSDSSGGQDASGQSQELEDKMKELMKMAGDDAQIISQIQDGQSSPLQADEQKSDAAENQTSQPPSQGQSHSQGDQQGQQGQPSGQAGQSGDTASQPPGQSGGQAGNSPSQQTGQSGQQPGGQQGQQGQQSGQSQQGDSQQGQSQQGQGSGSGDSSDKQAGQNQGQSGGQQQGENPSGQTAQGQSGGSAGQSSQGQSGQGQHDNESGNSTGSSNTPSPGTSGDSSQPKTDTAANSTGQNAGPGMRENATGGSSDTRGQVDVKPQTQFSPEQVAQLQSLGRVINETARQLRDDSVDPKLLAKLGMTKKELSAFVEKYTSRMELLAPVLGMKIESSVQKVDFTVSGSSTVGQGRGADGSITNTSASPTVSSDGQKGMNDASEGNVSQEYQRQVEDYFRAVSEGGAKNFSTSAPAK